MSSTVDFLIEIIRDSYPQPGDKLHLTRAVRQRLKTELLERNGMHFHVYDPTSLEFVESKEMFYGLELVIDDSVIYAEVRP